MEMVEIMSMKQFHVGFKGLLKLVDLEEQEEGTVYLSSIV